MKRATKHTLFRCATLVLIALLGGCGKPGERIFKRGERAFDAGQYVRAKTYFENALNKQPGNLLRNAEAYNYLGLCYWKLGKLDQAIDAFEESRRLNPDLVEPAYNLALLMLRAGETLRALDLLEEAGLVNLSDPRPLEMLAWVQREKKNWPEARRALYEALSRAPKSPRILTALALTEIHTEGPEAARAYLMQALESDPRYPPALFNLALIHERLLNNRDQAEAFYRQYLEAAPQGKMADYAQHALDHLAGKTAKPPASVAASKATPSVAQAKPASEELVKKAYLAARGGHPQEALNLCLEAASRANDPGRKEKALRTATALCFDQSRSHLALGRFLLGQQRVDEALKEFKQAAALAPEDREVLFAVAQAATRTGEFDAALHSLKKAVALDPHDPDALWALAALYDRSLKLEDKAVRAYHEFERLFPGDPRIVKARKRLDELQPPAVLPAVPQKPRIPLKADVARRLPVRTGKSVNRKIAMQAYNRGTIYQQREDWDRAIYAYRQAVENDPGFLNAYYNLALAYEARGNLDQAREALLKCLEINPDLVSARYNLARIYYQLRQEAAAVEHLKHALKRKPDYAPAHLLLGMIYAGNPRTADRAASQYRAFLKIAPHDPSAPRVRAWLKAHARR